MVNELTEEVPNKKRALSRVQEVNKEVVDFLMWEGLAELIDYFTECPELTLVDLKKCSEEDLLQIVPRSFLKTLK